MPELAYINDQVVPIDEASVPARDRGFIFGDGVYDVARVYEGQVHRLGAHVDRILRCAGQIELRDAPEVEEFTRVVDMLVEQAGLEDAMVYMQLTRGVAPRQSAYLKAPPTLYVSVEHVRRGADQLREPGVTAILVEDIRWARNDIKTVNLLPKVVMGERASQAGAYEALYRDDGGTVWEGTSTNLFGVVDGRLRTAPECSRILSGTTRRDVLDLVEGLGVDYELRAISEDELFAADELFVTGTLTEVQGLVEVDGRKIGSGDVGPITRELQAAYDNLVQERLRGVT